MSNIIIYHSPPMPDTFLHHRLLCASLVLALAGCTHLHTPYEARGIDVPAHWSATTDASAAPLERPALQDAWWKHLGDAELDRLITLALAHNSDLRLAAWNLRQAEIALGQARNQQAPTPGASASATASHDFDAGSTSRNNSLGLSLNYELDLWGKLASEQSAAQWQVRASEQDVQTTAIALVASVAQLYGQLANQNEQITAGQHSLDYLRRTQQLVQAQYAAGGTSGLEVQEARRSLASQEAALRQLRHNRSATRNALAVLLHQSPSEAALAQLLPSEPQSLPQTVADIPAGIPAEVLARRPDVQATEQRLRATLAQGDATRASYYPSITLTGGLNSASRSLSDLLSNPIATLGASLSLPFLRQTEMRLSQAATRASYEAAVVQFQKTLLTALQEVEDALSNRNQLAEQRHWLSEQLDAARQAESLNEVRYRAGATPLKTWLDAQEARRNAELALAANRLQQWNNQLTLYKALGGDTTLPTPALPDVPTLMQKP